jgi:hypothetical protein
VTAPRPASESPFPYASRAVCYFHVVNGVPEQVSGKTALREALADGLRLFAAWPGQWRTDLFVIDRPELLAEAISTEAAS